MLRSGSRAYFGTAALCGNPNVGKSTVFNALTGLHQHTGNWTGKTVETARGEFELGGGVCGLVDLPGCRSLNSSSPDEEAARSFILSGEADCTVVVCDASLPERSIFIVLQVLALTKRVVVCLNLCGEALKRGIRVDPEALSKRLGVEVVTLYRADKRELGPLKRAILRMLEDKRKCVRGDCESCCEMCGNMCFVRSADSLFSRDYSLLDRLTDDLMPENTANSFDTDALWREAESIADAVTTRDKDVVSAGRLRLDRLLTGRITGRLAALALFALVLYLTMIGANYPSALLALGLDKLLGLLRSAMLWARLPEWLTGCLCDGVLRTLFTVVSVMLPPMAIFFPLFTLFEDIGLLPRIAFDLDRRFMRCRSCGKQALTMCIGLGCNAVGVTGCRIIGSRRERLLAILTNSLMPCNGRFPALAALSALFAFMLTGGSGGLAPALVMLGLLLLAVGMTFAATWLLSRTVLAGKPSAFLLELPPLRKPRIGQVIVRSLIDRTAKTLLRAVIVSAPAGLVIYLLERTGALSVCAGALDPIGRLMGLSGGILLAFALGLPANELILPLALAISTGVTCAGGALGGAGLGVAETAAACGWTPVTVLCMMILMLFHAPCATTLLTVSREAGGSKYALAAFLLPSAIGVLLCVAIRLVCVL